MPAPHRSTSPQTNHLDPYTPARPGTPIVLYVCEDGWQECPTERVTEIAWTVPAQWNGLAVRNLIGHVLSAMNDRSGPANYSGPQAYCWFRYSKADICGRHLHLSFDSRRTRYCVGLPTMPKEAIADFLCDPDLSPDIHFRIARTVSPSVQPDLPRARGRMNENARTRKRR